MKKFRVKFTKDLYGYPEYTVVDATSRENAMTIFYGMHPTYFVINVTEL